MRSQGYAARAHALCGGRSRPRTATPARRLAALLRPQAPRVLCRVARRAELRPMRRAQGRRHAPASLLRDARLPWRWLHLRRHAPLQPGVPAASAASLSALSLAARACVNSSRSPPRVASRLWEVTPTRWSVIRPCGKLYVRTFAERSPVPTCAWRRAPSCSALSRISRSSSLDFRILMACSLFWSWLFSFWQVTTSPVGLCVILTAESVVFTLWPPGPLGRYPSTSTSSASGRTATVAVEVCMRPWLSVLGTRWTLCVPPSCLKTE